jgi:endonuclease-3
LVNGKMRTARVLEYLRRRYDSRHSLSEPFRVLIATILSQRTRDENTDRASSNLFEKYKNALEIVEAPVEEIERLIRPAGFYRVKARKIQATARMVLDRYDGQVPSTLEELLALPGVGQKTANCVLAYAFGIPALPVDVHVHRISNRIGIVSTRSPLETEERLTELYPPDVWSELSLLMIRFGRDTCIPRIPRCERCGLAGICEYARSGKHHAEDSKLDTDRTSR